MNRGDMRCLSRKLKKRVPAKCTISIDCEKPVSKFTKRQDIGDDCNTEEETQDEDVCSESSDDCGSTTGGRPQKEHETPKSIKRKQKEQAKKRKKLKKECMKKAKEIIKEFKLKEKQRKKKEKQRGKMVKRLEKQKDKEEKKCRKERRKCEKQKEKVQRAKQKELLRNLKNRIKMKCDSLKYAKTSDCEGGDAIETCMGGRRSKAKSARAEALDCSSYEDDDC
ncbi:hypothetical protein WDU94_007660 [Cyamophila willieti]